jgi:hypothetical protein
MSNNEYVAPVNHGTTSAIATTTYEAGKSGLKGLVKSLFAGTVVGGVVAGSIAGALTLFGGMAGVTGIAAAGALAVATVGSIATFGVIGALVGTAAMFIPPVGMTLIGLGTAIGLVKGVDKGMERVSQERGAAAMVNAQVDAYKAQAVMNGVPSGKFQAAANMNTAPSLVQTGNDNMQYDGRLAGAELAAAR